MNKEHIDAKSPHTFSKKKLKKYITELMHKYRDKPDAIVVLHEIFLMLNEPWNREK